MKKNVLVATLAALFLILLAGGVFYGEARGETPLRTSADGAPVDREWQKILAKNGTLYDAYLRLDDIMKNGKPSHPDTVKLPKGLTKANYNTLFYLQNYPLRDREMQTAKTPADMAKVAGRYVQVQDILTDYGQIVGHIANGFHLVLKADGTGTYDKYGSVDGESYVKPVKWNDKTITLTFPRAMTGHYTLDGNRLIYCSRVQGNIEEIHTFERESDVMAKLPLSPGMVLQLGGSPSDEKFSSNAVISGPDLGKELPGKLYRLTQWSADGTVTKADAGDPISNPADHFVVLVKTGERGGYGYFRNGDTEDAWFYPLGDTDEHRGTKKDISFALLHDTFFYWDAKDKIFEYWLIERPGYGAEKKYGRFELSGKTLKWYPRWYGGMKTDLCMEYALAEGEKPPVSHLAIGPADNRNFEIPDGPRTRAGFWRLDRITGYADFVGPPLTADGRKKKAEEQAKAMQNIKSMEALKALQEKRFTCGEDVRKYGVDLWYVLEPDGTGYMRMWDKYFELVWNDNEIYYYDVSGRHILSIGVGTILGDKGGIAQTRLFKDELNPVPPRPKELGGKR